MGFLVSECVNNNTNSTTPLDRLAHVIGWVTFAVGLPAIGLAIYALKHMAKGRNGVPFHIISLLVSDIFNFIGRPQVTTQSVISPDMSMLILYFGVVSNITFMVCIAQERHLQTAWPQCQGFFTRVKSTALFSMVMWAAPFAILALAVLKYYFWFAVTLLLPFPLLLFFLLDSWRAFLCCRLSPTPEMKRTVVSLAIILTNYTLLFLPFVLNILLESLCFLEEVHYLGLVANMLLYLTPLVDPFLYIFMTKGPKELAKALSCCRKREMDHPETISTVSEIVTRL
ncbi:ovarian cancer G-protein coupled receptor 1 [Hypomesus transpacificus]|uniref:ovarian cancer G-protein coupled receptor 1 n=1 Tax=Hypomesus transpacificus TaxID=137520 RepID=UPI001F07B7B6|nr:ovarian cancer G-protein coupled receptor 1 [Hypomesus transpacificus]XP_046885329.1 ovarian cancer G-protein coupled receptor 1 [Hypomesus transpacificus]